MTRFHALHRPHFPALSALALVALVALGACTPEVQSRGNEPSATNMSQVKVGASSRADVMTALGTPSTSSLFDGEETWFYISAKTQQYAFFASEELERKVVVVQFDQQGMVKDLRTLSKEDGTDIAILERTTPTAGNELTVMQQLLGNIGRFSGEKTGTSSRAPSGL